VDDDTEISDQDPAMQDEVASLLREAIVTTAAGEQVDLPHAIAALIGRERLRGWFQSQMDDAPDDT
jgi:biopolymer transport protein ExbB/TolQ